MRITILNIFHAFGHFLRVVSLCQNFDYCHIFVFCHLFCHILEIAGSRLHTGAEYSGMKGYVLKFALQRGEGEKRVGVQILEQSTPNLS